MARLGSLTQLDLGHLHLIVLCLVAEAFRIEITVVAAGTEIAGTQFPDDVAAMFEVIG